MSTWRTRRTRESGVARVMRPSRSQNGVALVGDFYRSLVTERAASGVLQVRAAHAVRRAWPATKRLGLHRRENRAHPAPGAHARRQRVARLRGLPQVDRALRDLHDQAQGDALLGRVRLLRLPRWDQDRPNSASTAITSCTSPARSGRRSTRRWSSDTGKAACPESCHTVAQCQQCHTTGETPEFTGLPNRGQRKSIEELHVKPEWTSRYHGTEALKDVSQCLKCHQSEGECDECHLQRPAFHGSTDTWIGRHSKQATKVDDPRCLACHEEPWCEECHDQFKEME